MNGPRICVVCSKVFRTELTTCPDDGTPLSIESEPPQTKVGSVLGNYRLIRSIGEGGAGSVYEAEHLRLGRRMAIKLLHSDVVSEEMVVRFFNEARAVNEIRHPNIIDIEDFVSTPTGEHYMVMELLHGEDLRTVISREGVLAPERVAAIGEQLAAALTAVHRYGIVHRDLKPENIFLTKTESGEQCKLLDFGVAKFTRDPQGVTRAGMTIGTPAYMAPEQIMSGGSPGPASDIYALGMVMYEALAGAPAFTATSIAQVLRAHCSEPVTPPSERRGEALPAALEAVVLKCLAKNAADRFPDCEALCAGLTSDHPVEISPKTRGAPSRWRSLLEVPVVVTAVVALALQVASREDPAAAATRRDPVIAVAPVLAPSAPTPRPAPPSGAADSGAPVIPPLDQEVTLVVGSQPAHARLFLGDELKPLGETPATISIARSSDPVSVIARFSDGTEVVQRIVPDRSLPPITFIKPAPRPVTPAVKPAGGAHRARAHQKTDGGGSGRDETVDPFTFK